MRRLPLVPLLMVVAIVAGVLLLRGGSEDTYDLQLKLANAGGLKDGSPVVIGGVGIGEVKLDAKRDHVLANLKIEKKYAPIGKDTVAGIIAQNVIGQKQVKLDPGKRSGPAPDGYTIPSKQVLETTDLDQLLSTLDPDTRTRLAILINETGTAFAGRKMDFATFMRDFAPALRSGGKVLQQLAADNAALQRTVELSDRFVGELAAQRRDVGEFLNSAGETAETVAAKHKELQASLREAPRTFRTLEAFFVELERASPPIGRTARLLKQTAPSLVDVLKRVGPFADAVSPTLRAARPLGPIAYRTGKATSKMVKRLIPTTELLQQVSENEIAKAGPVVDGSIDNALGAVDNWSRAIQFRDGLGHVFRGEASLAPETLTSILQQLAPTPRRKQRKRGSAKNAPADAPQQAAPKAEDRPKSPIKLPTVDLPIAKGLLPKVQKVLDGVLAPGLAPKKQDQPGTDNTGLLDFLLGD